MVNTRKSTQEKSPSCPLGLLHYEFAVQRSLRLRSVPLLWAGGCVRYRCR